MRKWVFLLVLSSAVVWADEGTDNEELPVVPGTRDCVSLGRIDRTRIVNDSTILFYMLGSDVYVNHLPRRCNGLKRMDAFSYETSIGQLCSLDIIRGLRRLGGSFTPAAACGLGKFVPVTEAQIELILAEPELEPEPLEPELEAIEPEIEDPAAGRTGGSAN